MKVKPTFFGVTLPHKVPFNTTLVLISGYVTVIVVLEVIGVFGPTMLSIAGDALLIPILLNHYVLAEQAPYRRLLPALALIPLLRIFSLAIPLRELPELYWYMLVGLPLLLATFLIVRLLGLSAGNLGLKRAAWLGQFLIALSGVPLGWIAFLLFRPQPLVGEYNLATILAGVVILTIFAGFVEEIIFRGVLQRVASEVFGLGGLVLSNGLFTLMYLGNLSWGYLLFMGLAGFYFGWSVRRTGSIWGVALAHSLLTIGLLLVWPFVWG